MNLIEALLAFLTALMAYVAPITTPVTLSDLMPRTSWPQEEWTTVEEIAWCESRHDPSVIGDGGLAYGLMQIRVDYHPIKARRYDLLDPVENLEAAYEVYVQAGESYWPWSCAR